QGSREDGLPPQWLPGRAAVDQLRRAARQVAGRNDPALRPRHAAEEHTRSGDVGQAQRLRRSRPPPRSPAPRAARAARGPSGQLNDVRSSPQMPAPLTQTTGRRKQAVARVRFRPGQGAIRVNKQPIEAYFTSATHRMLLTEPLRVTNTTESYDIDATIDGGGISGQAGAMRLGIARSLCEMDPEHRAALKRSGLLTRDAREKESKKYGLKKARKAPQYSKRLAPMAPRVGTGGIRGGSRSHPQP